MAVRSRWETKQQQHERQRHPEREFAPSRKTHLSCQVLQDSGRIDGGGGSNTSMARRAVLQVPVDTTDGELGDKRGAQLVNTPPQSHSAPKILSIYAFSGIVGISKSSVFRLTWSPARAERETAFAFAFPESLPALPPA